MILNKREQKMVNKAYEQLQEVQASCSARLFNLKDIILTVEEAKKAFNKLDPVERKYLIKLIATNIYSVPVNYRWPAKSSIIDVYLNEYGTLTAIYVYRDEAPTEAYGGSSSIKVECLYE